MTSLSSRDLGREPRLSLAERLFGHAEVVLALARRDIRLRMRQTSVGYSWTYVAPLVWVAATYFAFWFFGRTSPVYTDIITFIISGLIPYAAFRYVIKAISRASGTVRGLLIFPSVTVEHAVASAALVEFMNIFVIYAVVALVNYVAFGNFELDNGLQFLFGVTLAWGLGASYGYLFAVFAEVNPIFRQVGLLLLRPSFFLSAIFFTANEVPEQYLPWFTWNPLLHAVEIARDGMLFHYQSRVAEPAFVILCILAMLGAGAVFKILRRS